MEKLIELLNEYDKIKWDKEEPIYNWKIAIKTKIYQTYLVSARYWFIKWLVENDKIDFSLIPNKIKEIWIPMKINWEIKYWFDSSDYHWLLMLLSISDTPIEDLVSYLR